MGDETWASIQLVKSTRESFWEKMKKRKAERETILNAASGTTSTATSSPSLSASSVNTTAQSTTSPSTSSTDTNIKSLESSKIASTSSEHHSSITGHTIFY